MITVKFFTTLRLYLKIHEIQLEIKEASNVGDIMPKIADIVYEKTSMRFMEKLLDEDSAIKVGTILLVNGLNVLDGLGLDTIVHDGDILSLFPPGGGG
jgi:molybdopterin converting factor small subunit